ncbi:putative nuclease HARBI1 [Salvia hispanica]|uniref:putative nuclease HARBI1 n=1 Tax=Salvia hispanica TaxID=49212 RepID=UPI00200941BF|nr:putative nuclease HARBI1 [Salvia hispanica]
MDRNAFGRLCILLRDVGGLRNGRYVFLEEQVAIFLSILAHHKKIRPSGFDFKRSGETISHYVHLVLKAVLRLHTILLPEPEPVTNTCVDHRWKHFKGCIGALDGTYINVLVSNADKPRYRSRKGQISTNTLAACDRNMRFLYFMPGWEGSAGDSRVLRDAVSRDGGLRVPKGNYFLCDNGYANCEGFLTPFKNVRYHLKEWGIGNQRPQNARELFNLRHSKARNIIERAFAALKMRWSILPSASFYPIKIQIQMIMACFLLHNFIRGEMTNDPIEQQIDGDTQNGVVDDVDGEAEYIDQVETSTAWTQMREDLANSMWNNVCICI